MTAQSYSIWATLFVPVCCKWANMLSHQPNVHLIQAGHIQRAACFFLRSIYPEGTMSDTQQQRDRSKTNGDFRKRGLRLERTSAGRGIICKKTKPKPIHVCAAATTRCFIDPSCRCAPVPPVCLLTHLLSFGERNNIEEVSSGAEIIFTSCKQQTNIYSRSPLSKPPPLHVVYWSLSTAGWCGPVGSGPLLSFHDTQPNSRQRRQPKAIPSHGDAAICKSQLWIWTPTPLPIPPCIPPTAGGAAASSGIDSPHSTWACCHRLYISLDLIHC